MSELKPKEKLSAEIDKARSEIKTDDYPMSFGELANLYKDGELRINPAYQRLFRWSNSQKSAFFESILIGIPIPPIFVFELANGHWELIDGLQRTSTVLEFFGLLNTEDGNPVAYSVLSSTQYLPSLEGAVWDEEAEKVNIGSHEIGSENRIAIKRSKIGIQILRKGSEEKSKFELFQRLNGNGTPLDPQEFRTCVMVMLNESLYEQCAEYAKGDNFRRLINISAKQEEKQQDLDYLCRFLAHMSAELDKRFDVDEYITHQVKELFVAGDAAKLLKLMQDTADLLVNHVGDNCLRKYDGEKFTGKVGKTAFEVVFVGVASNFENVRDKDDVKSYVMEKISQFWNDPDITKVLGAGVRGTQRIKTTVPFGKALFSD